MRAWTAIESPAPTSRASGTRRSRGSRVKATWLDRTVRAESIDSTTTGPLTVPYGTVTQNCAAPEYRGALTDIGTPFWPVKITRTAMSPDIDVPVMETKSPALA